MIAVGLALEFCIVLMTPRFVAFALLPIIIVQVCSELACLIHGTDRSIASRSAS
jgi:hypothetical protein